MGERCCRENGAGLFSEVCTEDNREQREDASGGIPTLYKEKNYHEGGSDMRW